MSSPPPSPTKKPSSQKIHSGPAPEWIFYFQDRCHQGGPACQGRFRLRTSSPPAHNGPGDRARPRALSGAPPRPTHAPPPHLTDALPKKRPKEGGTGVPPVIALTQHLINPRPKTHPWRDDLCLARALLAAPFGPSSMCFLGTPRCLGCVVRTAPATSPTHLQKNAPKKGAQASRL
jgi:hypothetical protein